MLDRWSIMVFEKPIAYKPNHKMSMCHGFTTMLNDFVALSDYQLNAIIETDDLETATAASNAVCGLIKEYLEKISDNYAEDEQMQILSDILR